MPAVAFRAAANNHVIGSASISLTVPAGVVAGDLMLVFISSTAQQVQTIGVPAGWTQRTVRTAYNGYFTWFYRVAGAGEAGTTYSFGMNTSGMISAGLVAYSNVDTSAGSSGIINETTSYDSSGSTVGSFVAASMTATNPGNAMVRGWHLAFPNFAGNGYSINGAPAGTTKRVETTKINNIDSVCTITDASYAVGVATGAQTATSSSNGYWAVDSLELKAVNNPPTAPTVTAPNGGETIGNSVNITFTAGTDPDGDALTYDIDYTRDNGANWVNLATAWGGAQPFVWNTSAIAASTACRVRVRSRDTSNAVSAYDESNANFTITHNQAPNPATWASPANNSTLDRSVAQTLTFNFLDPDAGDVLTKFDYRHRLVGAPTWTTTGTQVGATPSITIPGGYLAAGTYEIQVLTYDGQGVAATGWSASLQFTMADAPAAPAVTAPPSGGTVSSNNGVAAWTVGTQTGYQVQQVADNAGAMADPNVPANIYSDTGQITGAAAASARNAAQTYPVNNRYQWTRVRIQNNGLWSAWSSVRYQVAYTPPAAVTVGVAAPPTIPDALQVTITLTPPAGSQPVVTAIQLLRQRITDSAGGVVSEAPIRVANVAPTVGGTVFTDYGVRSGHGYQYQAVAIGANTTVTRSPWVT